LAIHLGVGVFRGYPSGLPWKRQTAHPSQGIPWEGEGKKPPRLFDHQLTVTGRNSANKKVGNPGCKKVEHLDIKQKTSKILPGQVPVDV